MVRALFPFYCFASPAAAEIIGGNLSTVAVVALRAVVRCNRGLEIAHHQIEWEDHTLAFSTRVGKSGDVVIEFDVGTPGLTERVIPAADLERELDRLRLERERTASRRRRG